MNEIAGSLLWENIRMFTQIFTYNLIIVLNHVKNDVYYNFSSYAFFFSFFLSLLLSPQPGGVEALADHPPNGSEMSCSEFQLFHWSD